MHDKISVPDALYLMVSPEFCVFLYIYSACSATFAVSEIKGYTNVVLSDFYFSGHSTHNHTEEK